MSVNPFDIRTVILAKHAQHVVLIHFPIALFTAAVSVLIWFVFWIHLRARRYVEESLPKYRLPIEAVAVLLVGLTGHLGGFLSGVNGPG